MSHALVILAAGMGTRMKSDLPKVLHKIGGLPLVGHALLSGQAAGADRAVVVVGHGGERVGKAVQALDETAVLVTQEEQLGTGHAVGCAAEELADFEGDVTVLYGDTPFVRPETLKRMAEARGTHDVVVLGFHAEDPARYGRLVMDGDRLAKIVEFKDASEAERAIAFCNSGVMRAPARLMFELIASLDNNNASGEIYLTDIVAKANERGLSATAVACDEAETLGVDSREALARAEALFQNDRRSEALENGVTLTAPETVYFSYDTYLGRDVEVEPNVVFGPGVTVETGATIRAFSHIEGAHVGAGSVVGPYARLRPGAELSNDAKIGNFVEIKNAIIGEGSKVNHLSYVGDATLGDRVNIGAGTITCNYDGVMKHKTEIGNDVFVGSDTLLVAPVRLGDRSMTASGTVVTKDVPENALAIGRAKQENKAEFAVRLFEKLRAIKAKKNKDN